MAELNPPPDQTLDSPSLLPDQLSNSGSALEPPPPSLERNLSSSKLNAQAPEFVPTVSRKSPTPPPMAIAPPPPPPPPIVHMYPPFPPQNHLNHPHIHHQQVQQQFNQPRPLSHHQYHRKNNGLSSGGSGEQEAVSAQGQLVSSHRKDQANGAASNGLSDDAAVQKILNQVEYYFSDINLATTDHLVRFMNKDSKGYVPISVVATFKKIKALINSNSQLADVLRKSTKLVVSEDGKKVKRLHPLTGPDMEELQYRIVVAENLPADHCYQKLMKVFSSVGSVKSIRTCQPPAVNNGAPSASRQSKVENMLHINKLHAFVEYESIELAEKAVMELNDEDNWRDGLKVRLLLKPSSKSQQARGKKAGKEGEVTNEEEGTSTSEQIQNCKQFEDLSGESELHPNEHVGEEQSTEKEGVQKKGRNRGRGKGRGARGQNHLNGRGSLHIGSPPMNIVLNNTEHPTLGKPPPGPRMPDGTRGFSMGRGKPVSV